MQCKMNCPNNVVMFQIKKKTDIAIKYLQVIIARNDLNELSKKSEHLNALELLFNR